MTDLDPILAALDWPICECEAESCGGQCANEATLHTEFHAIDHCNGPDEDLNADGNRTLKLCQPCFQTLRLIITHHVIALGRYGRPMCIGCGSPIRCVKDVIREAEKL